MTLARPDAGVPTLGRARALSALGGLAYWQSDMPAAERAYVEGLAIERSQDDPVGLAEALYNLGFVRAISGKHAEARALYEEALEIASRIGDQPSILRYQEALAFLMFHMGEFAAARKLQEQNVAAFKAAPSADAPARAVPQTVSCRSRGEVHHAAVLGAGGWFSH